MYLFPLFQWHACKLAELCACIAKCTTTINKIYIYMTGLSLSFYSPVALIFTPVANVLLCG